MAKKDDKWVILSLVVVIAIEAVGWFISVGVMMNKIDENAMDIADNKNAIVELRKVNNRLIRIEVLMETVVVGNSKISENLAVVAAEQQKRGPIVREAAIHVRDKGSHR